MSDLPKYVIVQIGARTKKIAHLIPFVPTHAMSDEPCYEVEPRRFVTFTAALDEIHAREWKSEDGD